MKKKTKIFLVFTITFLLAYFIAGYYIHHWFILIHWNETATISDKLREYYFSDRYIVAIPSLIAAAICAGIAGKIIRNN